MASIILKRKTFAGMAMVRNLATTAGNTGKGMGNVMRSANAQIGKYDKTANSFKEGLANWQKNNKGGARDFIKTEQGQKLWNANRTQATATNKTVSKATEKAGMGTVNQAATNVVRTNNIKKTVGMGQGISNTWNSGAMGKAKVLGTGAALVGSGAIAVSMMSGGKSEQRGYSEKSTFHFKRIKK